MTITTTISTTARLTKQDLQTALADYLRKNNYLPADNFTVELVLTTAALQSAAANAEAVRITWANA